MAERIIMPKQGLQMTEGTIVEWLIPEGGTVIEGQPLFVIETDKVTITVDAIVSGILLKIIAGEGTVVPVTGTVGIVGSAGEDISLALADSGAGNQAAPPRLPVISADSVPAERQGRVFISPRAKTRALEMGIEYRNIRGSAPDGMIIERDIFAARSAAPKATPLAKKTAVLSGVDLSSTRGSGARGKITRSDVEMAAARTGEGGKSGGTRKIVPLRGMRKIIAERMKLSLRDNAQAVHRVSVRMDEAVRVRTALDKTTGFNDLIALATVRALRDFPALNAEIIPGGIWQKDFVNLGIAVALDDGLIVPVVQNAELLSLAELSAAIKGLAEKARAGVLEPDDYTGGSFTLSNLGMYGLEEFTAIINPPEAAILAVGKIDDTPVAVNGVAEIHPVMKLTLSYDHRVVDGAPAAQFLSRIKEYLENPYRFL